MRGKWRAQRADGGAHAARGFVGGATIIGCKGVNSISVSMPHAALWVVQPEGVVLIVSFIAFQCRTRLCGWCNNFCCRSPLPRSRGFNAARGFVGGATTEWRGNDYETITFQCRTRLCGWCNNKDRCHPKEWAHVSMPHAALWVVQPHRLQPLSP